MKVYKKELPAGVRKMFTTEKGVKVKIVNSLYTKNKKGMEIGMYNDLYNNLLKKVDEGNKCVVLTFLNSTNKFLKFICFLIFSFFKLIFSWIRMFY